MREKRVAVELLSLPEAIARACGPTSTREILDMGMANAWKFARECAESLGCKLFADASYEEIEADRHLKEGA